MPNIAIDLIKKYEGCKLAAYWDLAGECWTVGYGATGKDICKLTHWTQDVAEHDLKLRLDRLLPKLIEATPHLKNASEARQAALLSFIYNGGIGMYTNHSVKPFVDSQDWTGAAKEILLFDRSGGKRLPGLTSRRHAESELLLRG